VTPIPFPDGRGYPVRLRRTGALLGHLACAIPAERAWLEFYLIEPAPVRPPPLDAPFRPVPHFRLVWDWERGCLWADGPEFLRLDGATPA
jgi:hypothetical protein